MSTPLRQFTAVDLMFGPFLDETDGSTLLTGLSIAQADVRVSKGGAAFAQKDDASASPHAENGFYTVSLSQFDTDTAGLLMINIKMPGALPVWREYDIMNAQSYDALHGADLLQVDVTSIDGDTTAPTNLANQYNGIGYSDPTAPSTQQQVDQLSVGGGGGVNRVSDGYNLTTGGQTGTYTNTHTEDGVYHILTPTGGVIDGYYTFPIGTDGIPQTITIIGNMFQGDANVEAWNGVSNQWEALITLAGSGGQGTEHSVQVALLADHVINGEVRIRWNNTGLGGGVQYRIDRLLVTYALYRTSVGYANGQVWVDTINGTPGNTLWINGTADNPVDNWADAVSIATAANLSAFHIAQGSSIALIGDSSSYNLEGFAYNLDLANQNVSGMVISGAYVTGASTGIAALLFRCNLSSDVNALLYEECGLAGTFTFADTEIHNFSNCRNAAGPTPAAVKLEFGGSTAAKCYLYDWSGAVTLSGMDSADDVIVHGTGDIEINATCTGGDVWINGAISLTNNGTGMSVIDDTRLDKGQSASATWDSLRANYAIPNTFGEAIPKVEGDVGGNVAGSVNSVVQPVTVGTNNDKTGYTVSGGTVDSVTNPVTVGTNNDKEGYEIAGTKTTLDDLNDVSAAEVWSETTRTITGGTVGTVTNPVTVGTNNDKTGYSIAGTKNTLDDLNDVSTTDIRTESDGALVDNGLDHLIKNTVTGLDVTNNSVFARIVSKEPIADWDTYDNTTDSLEAIAGSGSGGAPTVEQIADAVWREPLADHSGVAGSTAEALDDAASGGGGGSDPQVIAAAVWDKARIDHTNVGSFGEGVASVQGSVTGNLDGSVVGSVLGKVGGIDVGGYGDIAAGTWNASRSSHVIAGTFGEGVASVQGNLTGNVNGTVQQVQTLGVQAQADVSTGVWDEMTDNKKLPGSFGFHTIDVTPAATANEVWREQTSGQQVPGSFGLYLQDEMPKNAGAETWDALIANHTTPDTFGAVNQQGCDDAQTIASQVWNTTYANHNTPGTFGSTNQPTAAAASTVRLSIAPIQVGVNDLKDSPEHVLLYQHAAQPSMIFTVVDGEGKPIDLLSEILTFAVRKVNSQDTLWKKDNDPTNGVGGITVGGIDNNLVTVTYTETDTAIDGAYEYFLWNNTTKHVYKKGNLTVQDTIYDEPSSP